MDKVIIKITLPEIYGRKLLMHAHRGGNQSGAGKENRLLFREQWMLLFFKSKMAEVFSGNYEFKMAASARTH